MMGNQIGQINQLCKRTHHSYFVYFTNYPLLLACVLGSAKDVSQGKGSHGKDPERDTKYKGFQRKERSP